VELVVRTKDKRNIGFSSRQVKTWNNILLGGDRSQNRETQTAIHTVQLVAGRHVGRVTRVEIMIYYLYQLHCVCCNIRVNISGIRCKVRNDSRQGG